MLFPDKDALLSLIGLWLPKPGHHYCWRLYPAWVFLHRASQTPWTLSCSGVTPYARPPSAENPSLLCLDSDCWCWLPNPHLESILIPLLKPYTRSPWCVDALLTLPGLGDPPWATLPRGQLPYPLQALKPTPGLPSDGHFPHSAWTMKPHGRSPTAQQGSSCLSSLNLATPPHRCPLHLADTSTADQGASDTLPTPGYCHVGTLSPVCTVWLPMPEILSHACRDVLLTLLDSNTTPEPTSWISPFSPCLSSNNLHQTTVALPSHPTTDTYLVLLYLRFHLGLNCLVRKRKGVWKKVRGGSADSCKFSSK